MTDDAVVLIEGAAKRFLEEVPALEQLKMVVSVELRGRGDIQQFRLELPQLDVTRGTASDAKVRVEMPRAFFNVMAAEGKVPDWVEAFTYGQAKASGPEQYLRLIVKVVQAQQEREQLKRATKHH